MVALNVECYQQGYLHNFKRGLDEELKFELRVEHDQILDRAVHVKPLFPFRKANIRLQRSSLVVEIPERSRYEECSWYVPI